jgi:hypothetical protein
MDSVSLINKNKDKILNVALIIISLVVASNIYKKQVAKIDSLKASIVEEEKKNQALDSIEKLDVKIDLYRKLLPGREASVSINDINNIARNVGVGVISIKPSGEEKFPDYTKYIYDLTVSSSDYDSLARFINALEANQTVYVIDTFSISSPSYNREKVLNANLRVSVVAMLE